MPAVLIELGKKHAPEYEVALMKAVHSALQDAFKILNNDIHVRLMVHESHRFSIPLVNINPDNYLHITIDCFSGRSLAVKRELYRLIVESLFAIGVPKDHIKILLRETGKENWGIRGGQAGCDVELGYKVEV